VGDQELQSFVEDLLGILEAIFDIAVLSESEMVKAPVREENG
jgi:hypothetical protein